MAINLSITEAYLMDNISKKKSIFFGGSIVLMRETFHISFKVDCNQRSCFTMSIHLADKASRPWKT